MISPKSKVLIVEDDTDLRELLVYHLRREGFLVLATSDGYEGLEIIRHEQPHVVLLDLMLERFDGLQICRQLRHEPVANSPSIIIVSARTDEEDVLQGLSLGADDYVRKPFKPKEVVARVKTVLRRGHPPPASDTAHETIAFPPLTLNHVCHEVTLDSKSLALTATEYRLLHFLMRHPERVFNRAQLLAQVSDHRPGATGRNIDVHVRSLRRKLGAHASFIDTARGVGYRFLPSPATSGDASSR